MSCNQKDSYPKYLTTPLLMKANKVQKKIVVSNFPICYCSEIRSECESFTCLTSVSIVNEKTA